MLAGRNVLTAVEETNHAPPTALALALVSALAAVTHVDPTVQLPTTRPLTLHRWTFIAWNLPPRTSTGTSAVRTPPT